MKQTHFSVVGPMAAAAYVIRGFKLLGTPALRRFVWIPLLINLLLYTAGFWLAAHYFTTAMNWLIPGWLDWLRWLLWPLFALLLLASAFFTFTLVTNLIGAPFYGLLAERVLSMEGHAPFSGREKGVLVGAAESLASEGQRTVYFALRALPILGAFFVPVVNLAAPFLWMAFGAWSLSLEYMSYPYEALGILFGKQREMLRGRKAEVLAFGGVVMLGLAIPVLNIFVPPAAVVGATLYVAGRKS